MEELLPKKVSFSLKELEELGFVKITTAKKLINEKKLKAFKVGIKYFVLRDEVVNFVNKNSCREVLCFKTFFLASAHYCLFLWLL